MHILLLQLLIFFTPVVNALEVNDTAVSCPATMKGREGILDLQKFSGKVVYLDFWATWCPPCKKSMPFLNNLRNELVDQGFEIIAINVDEEPDALHLFLKKYPVDYQVAMDATGQCPKIYNVKAMPSAYLIDRKGVIRYIHLGFREGDKGEIRSKVMELLSEQFEG